VREAPSLGEEEGAKTSSLGRQGKPCGAWLKTGKRRLCGSSYEKGDDGTHISNGRAYRGESEAIAARRKEGGYGLLESKKMRESGGGESVSTAGGAAGGCRRREGEIHGVSQREVKLLRKRRGEKQADLLLKVKKKESDDPS